MGYVTVLVQHAWVMQPALSQAQRPGCSQPGRGSIGVSTAPKRGRRSIGEIPPASAGVQQEVKNSCLTHNDYHELPQDVQPSVQTPRGHRRLEPKRSAVRLSVPGTVADFVQKCNSATGEPRKKLEIEALDVLKRLEHMVLASQIADPLRKREDTDTIDIAVPLYLEMAGRGGKSQKLQHQLITETGRSLRERETIERVRRLDQSKKERRGTVEIEAKPTRSPHAQRFSSICRRSVLTMTQIHSKVIQDKAFELLIEALDTNELATDNAEATSLLLLVKEIGDLIDEQCRRIIRSNRKEAMRGSLSDTLLEDTTANVFVKVDQYLELFLLCLSHTLQRLEYSVEAKQFAIPHTIQVAFKQILEATPDLQTDDPHISYSITCVNETIDWLLLSKTEDEEVMAGPIALSLLARILRMTPPNDIDDMTEPFCGILEDLHEKREWHIGRKFIKLLASASLYNEKASRLFLRVLSRMDRYHWSWLYLAMLSLGVLSLSAETSTIRRIALEEGLMVYCSYGDQAGIASTANGTHPEAWKVRAGAVSALSEIYYSTRAEAAGLLIRETLEQRRVVEQHSHVKMLLDKQSALGPFRCGPRRLSFLFKYICVALAEAYAESQSRYIFLRKYLKTTEGRRKRSIRSRASTRQASESGAEHKPENAQELRWEQELQEQELKRRESARHIFKTTNVYVEDYQPGAHLSHVKRRQLEVVENSVDLNHFPALKTDEIPKLNLSSERYHEDYKTFEADDTESGYVPDIKIPHAPSVLGPYRYNLPGHKATRLINVIIPSNGTVNKRKLFNHHSESATVEEASADTAPHHPSEGQRQTAYPPIVLPGIHDAQGEA
ncbi:uncharacterized protein BJ171DRAFT_599498 [Polychytrium aggregatum]|uniref:uncharacterized protein n=1 Tax=Polychytrium aggregatum TaxID=110093 RepID=UPI0022FE7C46|nr:uncharacterized protein BJ171DRAFT_599498 [Polychytrium aggregatum]KAI9203947.1 hypothetical protein BJ171DRAFT_599498 [Polychytrium aggregatum]